MNDELAELALRLKEKAHILATMVRERDPNDELDRARLVGKVEGVRLALSFVEEIIRASS